MVYISVVPNPVPGDLPTCSVSKPDPTLQHEDLN